MSKDFRSEKVFAEMKICLNKRGWDYDEMIIDENDSFRLQTTVHTGVLAGKEELQATYWLRYDSENKRACAGVCFPEIIPDEKMSFVLAALNTCNSQTLLYKIVVCPVCKKVEMMASIFVAGGQLSEEKFMMVLSINEALASEFHPLIIDIIDESQTLEMLILKMDDGRPELQACCGGGAK